jgi:hypothetical protein
MQVDFNLYHFEAFACLEFVASESRWISLAECSRSSFCSYWFYLCAGEDVAPSSSDANDGCQWEVWTDEGWVPYWDSQA